MEWPAHLPLVGGGGVSHVLAACAKNMERYHHQLHLVVLCTPFLMSCTVNNIIYLMPPPMVPW